MELRRDEGLWTALAIMAMTFAREFLPLPELVRSVLLVLSSLIVIFMLLFRTSAAERWFSLACIAIVMGATYYIDQHPDLAPTTRRLIGVPVIAVFFVWIIGMSGGLRWYLRYRGNGVRGGNGADR